MSDEDTFEHRGIEDGCRCWRAGDTLIIGVFDEAHAPALEVPSGGRGGEN